jgi:hypothetical protein
VDGVFVGKVPVRQSIAPGTHQVTLFEVAAGRRTTIDTQIEPGRRRHIGF